MTQPGIEGAGEVFELADVVADSEATILIEGDTGTGKDLLAQRLQSALQRFAKPWWKRRAVRIFRDESSLSANPHLWSSITEALDSSGWFVLLLSPDAARSEWVNQEIGYWVEHRDPKKILPVVTDGTFGWVDGAVTGDAVPDALRGVFTEELRWVDVRWAKDEDQLDLQDPRFADAVADIASAMRGVPKDELASEEVRRHRQTLRTAWAAAVAGPPVLASSMAAPPSPSSHSRYASYSPRIRSVSMSPMRIEPVVGKTRRARSWASSSRPEPPGPTMATCDSVKSPSLVMPTAPYLQRALSGYAPAEPVCDP